MAEYASTLILVGVGVAAVAALASTGIATYGAVKQAKDSEAQAKSIQQQREFEAKVAQENANFEERQHRRRIALVRGAQDATYAAAGLDTTSGTPLVNDIDLVTQGELEALMLKRQGALASSDKMFEAGVLGRRARAYRGSIGYSIAGGSLSGIASAGNYGASAGYALRPTTTQIQSQASG